MSRRAATALIAGTIVVAIVILVVVRVATMSVPDIALLSQAPQSVQLSGAKPQPAWPARGQAAISVENVGSLGASPHAAPQPTASLAKVMTAYLILRQYPLRNGSDGFSLTISAADAADYHADVAQGQSTAAVAAGERVSERQLLEALLIPSGDNIAQILAVHAAGSVQAFVAEMNAAAKRLGMDHTTYTDPSGFLSSTVSTAADQLKVFEAAIRSPVFDTIVSMDSVTLPVAGTVHNYDPLLDAGYAGKTGSDTAAEGCLAFFKHVTVAGRQLTVAGVVMGQGYGSTTTVILAAAGAAAERLVASVAPNLSVHTVLAAGSAALVARSADNSTVTARTVTPLRVIGWGGLTAPLRVTPRSPGTTLRSGQGVGDVTLASSLPTPHGGVTVTSVRASGQLGTPGLGWRLAHIF